MIHSELTDQLNDLGLLDANVAEGSDELVYDEYEDYDDEYGANYSAVDSDINGYTIELIDMASGNRLASQDEEEIWKLAEPTVICLAGAVSEPEDEAPIQAAIDSACTASLLDLTYINRSCLSNVRRCHGVAVRGIDRKAAPIPASYVARHSVIDTVFLGEFKNLISVCKLFDSGHSIDGNHNHINVRNKDGIIVLTGIRDKSNLFMTDLSRS